MDENSPSENKPLTGVSVQIATPCMDAKYDRTYTKALTNTLMMLHHYGAQIDWAEFPYCSDIALARSKLFGNFMRSKHTHLMMIDADMGWDPNDVVQLLMLKRDLVGAAGPKKKYPLEFAANNCDDNGDILKIDMEPDTGIVECTEVGMAFMLMSKDCANKMAGEYQDLKFVGDKGTVEYALYDSFLVGSPEKRRRLSEDFAFCHRWRRIGGKIYLVPFIKLTHTGSWVWEGALIEALVGKPLDEKTAA